MRVLLVVVLGLAASVSAAGAQEIVECTPGVTGLGIFGIPARVGAFSATVKTTFEQRLIDGNVISGESHTRVAQNSEGWIRQESVGNCRLDEDGKPRRQLQVSVAKPKPQQYLHWTEGWDAIKEATISRPVELTAEQRAAELAKAKAQAALRLAPRPELKETKTESLGSATIAGMETTGTRTVRTIPPGEEGNSMPLVVTNEQWRTKDGMIVRRISNDPRRGKTTFELEDVIHGEPDASLFAPPEGYKVKEFSQQERVLVEATAKTP